MTAGIAGGIIAGMDKIDGNRRANSEVYRVSRNYGMGKDTREKFCDYIERSK
jgi:hypothetical protein